MIPVLIEAALRALLVALTVWAGLRILRVSNVLAQKIVWGLVLVCAVVMPQVMRWQVLPASMAFRLPVTSWRVTPKSLPLRDALLLSTHAEGLVVAPQARLVPVSEPEPSGGDRFPAPIVSRSEFNPPDRTQSAETRLAETPAIQTQAAAQTQTAIGTQVEDDSVFARIGHWIVSSGLLQPGTLAGLFYLAVCVLLLARIGYGLALALRLWLAAEPFVPRQELNNREPGLGLRMRFSPAVSSPVTIGSGVLLPVDCLEWDAEKLRIVLAHERAHIRQGDFYLQLLAGLYAAVFWFSPLGWWLTRKLSDLGEAISDRAALEEAASRASYAQVLLEFAALPRPTAIGVAMARTTNLSDRIERLLNEASFRQAFAGSRPRLLLAVLLVPAALFAGTALIRVEAASSVQSVAAPASPAIAPSPSPAPAAAPAALEPPADPAPAVVSDAPAPAVISDVPAPAQVAAPAAVPAPGAVPAVASVPPRYIEIHDAADDNAVVMADAQDSSTISANAGGKTMSISRGSSYSYSSDGDSWALVKDSNDHVTFSGEWNDQTKGSIDKARKLTNGKFLWFTHGGKSYFLDDAATVAQIEAMYKPMEELGRQQEILGKQQEALGRQQEEMGRKQEQASVPTPDISQEMARLNEAVTQMEAKKGSTVSQEQIADIEGKIGAIQGRLGELQGQMGSKQGELGALQGKLGEQQGKLGEEQGKLGAQQGKLAEEANHKVKSIIDESLRDGKARPVE
jgi:hypothetical protein